MARISKAEITDMSVQDLEERIEVETSRYQQKKFAHAVSQIENPLELRWVRRDIARLKTELTQRKQQANKS